MLKLEEKTTVNPFALFNLGFRPFFLVAGAYAAIAMLLWMGVYNFGWQLKPLGAAQLWHAHEMVFGFSLAVIAGFLLTAVKNWTNVQTPYGVALMILLLLWLAGRILPFMPQVSLEAIALFDGLFIISLIIAVGYPIIRVRQWQHLFILVLLVLFLVANCVFYAGLSGRMEDGVRIGLYSGFYLVVAMIFLMGRRVIPYFIENGVDGAVQLRNYLWLDVGSPVLFIGFWFSAVILADAVSTAVLATLLFVMHGLRLVGWHTAGLWHKPLLWSLYLGYGFMVLGFAMQALVPFLNISPYLPLHAFAVGGIGVITLSMMARVALGHSGRNVFSPPKSVSLLFALLIFAALVRVLLPWWISAEYHLWIILSQFFWIAAFTVFTVAYLPVLWRPRIDGKFG